MDLGKEILKEIRKRKIPLCEGYTERIKRTKSYAALCAMYFKGDDWSLGYDFPGLDLLRKHREGIKNFNLLVDVKGNFLNLLKVAFLGDSDASIEYNLFELGNIRIRHNSKLKVTAKNNSKIWISALDKSDLEIEVLDQAEVMVFCYGPDVKIISKGNIQVIKENEFRPL